MTQKVFSVKGMTCGNCAKHVERALTELQGVSQVQVDLDNHRATIEYDKNLLTLETMTTALSEAGYTMEGPLE